VVLDDTVPPDILDDPPYGCIDRRTAHVHVDAKKGVADDWHHNRVAAAVLIRQDGYYYYSDDHADQDDDDETPRGDGTTFPVHLHHFGHHRRAYAGSVQTGPYREYYYMSESLE
jgi:hypothetical protein